MRSVMLTISLLALAAPVWAFHSRDAHIAQAGNFHVELVVKERDVTPYFWNRYEQPVDGVAVRAAALIRSGGAEATVDFVPVGESLQGHAPFRIGKDASVSVIFSVLNGPSQQADFALGDEGARGHKH